MKRIKTMEKGITLVALVVTIIVLIILAGISINLILGENGIIIKAQEAKALQTNAEANEKDIMDELEKYIENSIQEESSNIYNVKDYGALGDGITDDRQAIINTFTAAITDLPATVYFPEGEYGLLSGGIYIDMPLGTGKLTVKGDGAEKSTIKYLEEWETNGTWVALRIQPETIPSTVDEYLHDIIIKDLGVYDANPVEHAWTIEENGNAEETHGFNINYCVGAIVTDCRVNNVGDEAIDFNYCIDSVITNNYIENSPAAGEAGAAISVGDGSKNVRVTKNTVKGTVPNLVNFGIGVEALNEQVEEVVISNNNISNVNGWGLQIAAPAGKINNVKVNENTIENCENGIRFYGSGLKTNVTVSKIKISDVALGIMLEGLNDCNKDILIQEFEIDTTSKFGIQVASGNGVNICNGTLKNIQTTAIFNAGVNTKIDNVNIEGVGLAGGVTDGAIMQYALSGNSEAKDITITNCQNSKGIQNVAKVVNAQIEQIETSGFVSISAAEIIQDGKVNRLVQAKNGSTIDGLEISTDVDLGTHAITLYNLTNCTIKNCKIQIPSRYAIFEMGTSDYNIFMNNTVIGGDGIQVIGENSTNTNNTVH